MVSEADFYELQRLCPLTCPFLRKKKDTYVFLCLAYESFLEVDQKGCVKRNRRCGENISYGEFVDFKALLDKLNNNFPDIMTREQNSLLENVFQVLDKSEQHLLTVVLDNPDLADSFLKQFEKQPKDNDLLANTRAVLREYEEKDLTKDPVLQQKLGLQLDKTKKSAQDVEQQMQLGRLLEIQRNKQESR